jgi:regulatory protein
MQAAMNEHEALGEPATTPKAPQTAAKSLRAPSLKGRALRLLATREHSRKELEIKLAQHADSTEQLAQVLDELSAKGFINEARVVDSTVHKLQSKFGAARVVAALQQKGIATDVLAQTRQDLAQSELERAQAVHAKKFGQAPNGPQEHAKQMRFLASRGFGSETISKVLRLLKQT